jgi:hypothetical protein
MKNAGSFSVCLIAFCFVAASPGGAYTSLPLSNFAKDRRPIISVNHYRYDNDFDDDDFDDSPPPPPRRADPYPPPPDASPFLEILPPPRPANCGQYRYWNGEYCADARDQPPYVGPRW